MIRPMTVAAIVSLVLTVAACGVETSSPPAATPPTSSSTPAPEPTSESLVPSEPTSVQIPRIDIDEPIEGFGLDEGSRLLVPEDAEQVAWFEGGGRPGGTGPTVIYGHVDSRTGPAVFSRLGELAVGDAIDVTAGDDVVTYEVTEIDTVPQDQKAFPTEKVFGSTPTDTLRLITCTGLYDDEEGYLDNLIVSAVPA